MTAIGYLLIVVAVLVMRQIVVGRVDDLGPDLKDMTVALLNGDTESVSEVASRRGENVFSESPGHLEGGTLDTSLEDGIRTDLAIGNSPIAKETVELGDQANAYVWGATGPYAYDCSGLVWRALYNLGVYKGSRFTTSTFPGMASAFSTEVSSPTTGDIVVWPGRHMGVYISGDNYYSARSPSKGIGMSTVSGDSSYFSTQPRYWRVNNA